MGLIFIPKLTKKYFYFLFFSISAFLRDYISLINIRDFSDKDAENPIQKRYFDILTNVLSDCLQGIIVLFSRIRNKKQASNDSINNHIQLYNKLTNNKDNNNQKHCISSFFRIMLQISLLDFFCQLLFLVYVLIFNKDGVIDRKNQNFLLIIDILSRFFFCRFILDTYFYRHHIVSMIINFVVFIVLGFFDLEYIFNKVDTEISIYFAFLIILTIAYSLEDVLNKIALSRESLTAYSLLFYKGVFQIPLVIITSLIIIFIENPFKLFFNLDSNFKLYVLGRRALFIIFNIFRSIFLVKVIDKFSSQHLSILKVLESLFMFCYFLIDNKYKDDIIYIPVISVSFLILTFTSLVYNEILVINLCGLQDYTQHGLDLQAEKDLRDAVTEISEMSSDVSVTSESRSESFIVQNVSYTN